MKFLTIFLGAIALLAIVGGGIAVITEFPDDSSTTLDASEQVDTHEATATTTLVNGPTSLPDADASSTIDIGAALPSTMSKPVVSDVDVGNPSFALPTFPLASVEATYTETHTFGLITVRFRPGAYSEDHAAEIARQTSEALNQANLRLQTNWQEDLTVFLADDLFAEDCLGCQGFTESDFRWIFMLDDGSVVPDEFEALLVHEATHLIAGNEIHLPLDIFYVEGLATWVMSDELEAGGYVTPLQSTAWIYGAGDLPSLQVIMDDDFAGRMRKRLYYDAAGSFAQFVIETYGWDSFLSLYRQRSIESVLSKSINAVEAEWHQYLEAHSDVSWNGVDGRNWWNAATQVIDAYGRFYDQPGNVSQDQYRDLTLSRLALNRADVGNAIAFLESSGI